MKLSAILEPLLRAGVDPDVILDAVRAFEAQMEAAEDATKEKARARWRKWKASQTEANVSKRLQPLANNSRGGATRGENNLQTKIPTGKEGRKEDAPAARSFPDFWSLYPNKVGKRDAETAFAKALKRADLETILTGLRRYAAKTDDRPWCNPATWLNQDRWEDQPATVAPSAQSPPNGKPNAFTAYEEIARERGWTDEPERVPGDHSDAQRLSAERGGREGVVVDLRKSAGGDFR